MQVTIQKKYLIVVKVSENIFRAFLIVVNYIFDLTKNTNEVFVSYVEELKQEAISVWHDIKEKTYNFIRALFGYNIYKLKLVQIKTKTNESKNTFKNNDFLIFSNLLAPPTYK